MSIDQTQLAALVAHLPAARVMSDAGINYVFLPRLRVAVGQGEHVVDALLCPVQHGGYTTRLFLSEPIRERGQNWACHNILGRPWHTWSWNNVPPTLPLLQILLAHLRALR